MSVMSNKSEQDSMHKACSVLVTPDNRLSGACEPGRSPPRASLGMPAEANHYLLPRYPSSCSGPIHHRLA